MAKRTCSPKEVGTLTRAFCALAAVAVFLLALPSCTDKPAPADRPAIEKKTINHTDLKKDAGPADLAEPLIVAFRHSAFPELRNHWLTAADLVDIQKTLKAADAPSDTIDFYTEKEKLFRTVFASDQLVMEHMAKLKQKSAEKLSINWEGAVIVEIELQSSEGEKGNYGTGKIPVYARFSAGGNFVLLYEAYKVGRGWVFDPTALNIGLEQ